MPSMMYLLPSSSESLSLGQQNRASKSAQFPLFSSFKHQKPVLASICVTAYSADVVGSISCASTPIGLEQVSDSPKDETVSKSPVPSAVSRLLKADLNLHGFLCKNEIY